MLNKTSHSVIEHELEQPRNLNRRLPGIRRIVLGLASSVCIAKSMLPSAIRESLLFEGLLSLLFVLALVSRPRNAVVEQIILIIIIISIIIIIIITITKIIKVAIMIIMFSFSSTSPRLAACSAAAAKNWKRGLGLRHTAGDVPVPRASTVAASKGEAA